MFTQVGVLAKFVKGITGGSKNHYCDRMEAYLKEIA